MVLITNDCTAGQFYKDGTTAFPHPFVWSVFTVSGMCRFMQEYKEIDFNSITHIGKYPEQPFFRSVGYRNPEKKYYLIIDGKLMVGYSHYNEGPRKTRDAWNVFVPNCKDYVVKKYRERLERWNKDDEVIFGFNEKKYTKPEDIIRFIKTDVPNTKYIYTSHKEILQYSSNKVIVFYDPEIEYSQSFKKFAKKIRESLENAQKDE